MAGMVYGRQIDIQRFLLDFLSLEVTAFKFQWNANEVSHKCTCWIRRDWLRGSSMYPRLIEPRKEDDGNTIE